ncbi:MAG: hypothetical protein J6O61_13515 [Butyrivibrio sp.]|uniref:hypothetical protein n=1 Tax=Butyrivibrio sp. TaxID=28121 RepID=UPI001B04C57A|nr:hypothetical protein [Butyrivibrio sp.]MBO6241839.1 hypothetical protein [Butyrivibrio sp.]
MNMNPMLLMQLQQRLSLFSQDHPKVLPFFRAIGSNAMQEGTIIDIKVTTPDGKELASNIKLTANDIETAKMMMNMGNQQ